MPIIYFWAKGVVRRFWTPEALKERGRLKLLKCKKKKVLDKKSSFGDQGGGRRMERIKLYFREKNNRKNVGTGGIPTKVRVSDVVVLVIKGEAGEEGNTARKKGIGSSRGVQKQEGSKFLYNVNRSAPQV